MSMTGTPAAMPRGELSDVPDWVSKKDKALRLGLNAKTVTVEIDKSGRVALGKIAPSDLEKLSLGREAVVVGDADHFAVYNTEAWAAKQAELDVDIDALLDDED